MRGLTHAKVKPVPFDTFLDYVSWFMGQYNVIPRPALVTHLARSNGTYTATLDDGSQIRANRCCWVWALRGSRNTRPS